MNDYEAYQEMIRPLKEAKPLPPAEPAPKLHPVPDWVVTALENRAQASVESAEFQQQQHEQDLRRRGEEPLELDEEDVKEQQAWLRAEDQTANYAGTDFCPCQRGQTADLATIELCGYTNAGLLAEYGEGGSLVGDRVVAKCGCLRRGIPADGFGFLTDLFGEEDLTPEQLAEIPDPELREYWKLPWHNRHWFFHS